MATTPMTESGPMFNRVVERGRTSSWRAAAPAVVVLVLAVVTLAYLASKMSSYSQQAAASEREVQASRQQLEATLKRTAVMEKDLNMARSPGRTTVTLESKAKGAKSWAVATWGESEDGKTWMRTLAYGLQPATEGKVVHAWLLPQSGAPVDAGKLEAAQDGNAIALGMNLPAIDQGKRLVITLDADNAKEPGEVLMATDLPKLASSQRAPAAPAAAADQAAPAAEPSK